MTTEKLCKTCNIIKPYDEFNNYKKASDGKYYQCKECKKVVDKVWSNNNKEKIAQYKKEYANKNREAVLESKRLDYINNKEARLNKVKEYASNNKEKIAKRYIQYKENILVDKRLKRYENIISGNDKDEHDKKGILYKLLFTHKTHKFSFLKVGVTTISVENRYKYGYNDYEYTILESKVVPYNKLYALESKYHVENRHNKFIFPYNLGKAFDGYTECYNIQ